MRKLEEIEDRMTVLRGRLLILQQLVEEATEGAQLETLWSNYREVEAEIDQVTRDMKMAIYRLHSGLYP
jgi:hypothetical protein